jgi:hypothetical protein
MSWVQVVFGWPAVIVSVLTTLAGLLWASWRIVVTGAVVALPFMLYMFGTPRFMLVAPLIVASHFGAAYAVSRGERAVGFILFLPFTGFVGFVAWLVLAQPAG